MKFTESTKPKLSSSTGNRILIPRAARPSQQLICQPSTSLFNTEREQRYFTLFSEKVAADISPYFSASAWSRMILQVCASELSFRHAAVALGALGKTFEAIQTGRSQSSEGLSSRLGAFEGAIGAAKHKRRWPPQKDKEAAVHHQHALEEYDKAIKQMRADISGTKHNIRTALITCVVIICFESLHGNYESATAQLRSGIALVQDWKRSHQDTLKHPQGFSSPTPYIIEDFLIQLFGRLEIQAMSFVDFRPVECHLDLKAEGKDVINAMPECFISINQARVSLDLIMRRMMHFTASLNYFKASYAQYKISSRSSKSMRWIDSKAAAQASIDLLKMSKYYSERDALNSELNRWLRAFKPLGSRCVAKQGRDYISALTMFIAATTSAVSISTAFIVSETDYDVFESDFRSIVSQSALFLEELEQRKPKSRPALGFALDLG